MDSVGTLAAVLSVSSVIGRRAVLDGLHSTGTATTVTTYLSVCISHAVYQPATLSQLNSFLSYFLLGARRGDDVISDVTPS